MRVSAIVQNQPGQHQVRLVTDGRTTSLTVPPRPSGGGSSANGGELLFLALATCYCNDIYREAQRSGIMVREVEVTVDGEFGGPGEPARNLTYRARVVADASEDAIKSLMRHTDGMTEIQNTLRQGVAVELAGIEAIPTASV